MFDVYNDLGYGYQEKYYYRAIKQSFKNRGLNFKEQFAIPLKFKDSRIGTYLLDFLVEDKIVVEIKKGDRFSRDNISQVVAYLKSANLKLGILVNFTSSGIKCKRILNLDSYIRNNS